MKPFVAILFLTLLTVFVSYTAVRIEILNAEAEYYLPRQDKKPDGLYADGKWRVSLENTPRDRLRAVVESFGLLQYLLAPLLLISSALMVVVSKSPAVRIIAGIAALTAAATVCLMFYREYFSSLGG